MMPAIRNDSQTAEPATAPAAPRSAKMPAPTIEPTPMNVACSTVMRRSVGGVVTESSPGVLITRRSALRGGGEVADEQGLRGDHPLDLRRVDRLIGRVDARLGGVFSAPEQDRRVGRHLLQGGNQGDGRAAADVLDRCAVRLF